MGRRMVLVGLAVSCVLTVGALSASSAFAATTAFTCKAGQGSMNSHCVPGSSGTSGHLAINAGEETEMELKSVANTNLAGKLFGAVVEIEATAAECVGKACAIENRTSAGVMGFVGDVEALRFDGAHVVGLPGCTITDATAAEVPETFFTEALEFGTTVPGELTLVPSFGVTLAKFSIVHKPSSPEACTVEGENLKVTGVLKATLSGATLNFNITKAANQVKLEGEKASFRTELTMEAGNGTPYTPISLT